MSAANYSGEAPLALPKLNLQFLSPSDYLLRNFHLFRLEAAYEVREDIEVRVWACGNSYGVEASMISLDGSGVIAGEVKTW